MEVRNAVIIMSFLEFRLKFQMKYPQFIPRHLKGIRTQFRMPQKLSSIAQKPKSILQNPLSYLISNKLIRKLFKTISLTNIDPADFLIKFKNEKRGHQQRSKTRNICGKLKFSRPTQKI